MSPVTRLPSIWSAAVLCGFIAVGCKTSPSAPTTTSTTRPVTVAVQDSTGAAVQGATVFAVGVDDSNAGQTVTPVLTDAAGVTSLSLKDGHWIVSARLGPSGGPFRVAGSSGVVGPRPAGSPDSTEFRLALFTQSIAKGTITLTGRTSFDGTLVGVVGLPAFTITAADGSYELVGLPPGNWIALASHDGFQQGQFAVPVPASAQTITVQPIALAPNGVARP
jgi:hypothetical protein